MEFLRKHVIDFSAGPGYTAGENIRLNNRLDGQHTGTTCGPVPLYDFRIGPVNLSNIYSQPGFTQASSLRIGLLFTYGGDEYASYTVAHRKKTLFAGGFVGYGYLTAYGYTNIIKNRHGSIFALRFAPRLFRLGRSEFFFILEGQHMNRPYVDYYFGVRDYEATTELRAYNGKRTTNVSGTVLYDIHINRSFDFLLWGGEKRFGQGITHSPTVGLKHEYRAGVGIMLKIM